MLLEDNERFQKDIKRYSDAIEKINDSQAKLEAKRLLNDLIYEVKKMDNMYMDMIYSRQISTMGSDMRGKIVEMRKKLDSKLKQSSI
jgi:hypothetical protein